MFGKSSHTLLAYSRVEKLTKRELYGCLVGKHALGSLIYAQFAIAIAKKVRILPPKKKKDARV